MAIELSTGDQIIVSANCISTYTADLIQIWFSSQQRIILSVCLSIGYVGVVGLG